MASYSVILLMACTALAFSCGAIAQKDPVPVAKALAQKALDATQDLLNVAAAEKSETCVYKSVAAADKLSQAITLLKGRIDRGVGNTILTDGYYALKDVQGCTDPLTVKESSDKAQKLIRAFIEIAKQL